MWDILKWVLYVLIVVVLGYLVRLAYEVVRVALAERNARSTEENARKETRAKRVRASRKAA
jgi:hypothetical protein